MTREPEFVRSVRREEFIETAADLARSVPAEAEEPPKTAPALARACAVFRRFLDRIHLRCDGSQRLGQHVFVSFMRALRGRRGADICRHNGRISGTRPPSSPIMEPESGQAACVVVTFAICRGVRSRQ